MDTSLVRNIASVKLMNCHCDCKNVYIYFHRRTGNIAVGIFFLALILCDLQIICAFVLRYVNFDTTLSELVLNFKDCVHVLGH